MPVTEAVDLFFYFGHRWQIRHSADGQFVPCQEGQITGAGGEWLRFACPAGELAKAVARLPFVKIDQNDRDGLVVRFRHHRIHSLTAAGVRPLEVKRT